MSSFYSFIEMPTEQDDDSLTGDDIASSAEPLGDAEPSYVSKSELSSAVEDVWVRHCGGVRNVFPWNQLLEDSFTARPKAFSTSLLGVRRVVKQYQLGKDKSTKGYIWSNTDPLATLYNRFVIKSCHTLEAGSYGGGNFNHALNPYMGTLYAGNKNPLDYSSVIPAARPKDDRLLKNTDGSPHTMISHQAACNFYFMRDNDGRAYLHLVRIYDSSYENPWGHSLLRYVSDACDELGCGLTLSDCFQHLPRINADSNPLRLVDSPVALSSGSFSLPWRNDYGFHRAINGYGDGNLAMYVGNDEFYYMRCLKAYVVKSSPKSSISNSAFGDLLPEILTSIYCTTVQANSVKSSSCPRPSCFLCSLTFTESDNQRTGPCGNLFHQHCYNACFVSCSCCYNIFPKGEVSKIDDSGLSYCATCIDKYVQPCGLCNQNSHVSGNRYVMTMEYDGTLTKRKVCKTCSLMSATCNDCKAMILSLDVDGAPTFATIASNARHFYCSNCNDYHKVTCSERADCVTYKAYGSHGRSFVGNKSYEDKTHCKCRLCLESAQTELILSDVTVTPKLSDPLPIVALDAMTDRYSRRDTDSWSTRRVQLHVGQTAFLQNGRMVIVQRRVGKLWQVRSVNDYNGPVELVKRSEINLTDPLTLAVAVAATDAA